MTAYEMRISDWSSDVCSSDLFEENFSVYGARRVWRQLRREGFDVVRCTVERLMRAMGLEGAVRGKKLRTTISDRSVPCPADRVNRRFWAPRPTALWLSDFTYVSTWMGFVYVAFVIAASARHIPRVRPRRPLDRPWRAGAR